MAFSTTHPHKNFFKSQIKRSDAALKHYSSADLRLWKNDVFQRSIGLQDVLTRESCPLQPIHPVTIGKFDKENLSKDELLMEIKSLLEEVRQKENELDKIHSLYKSTSKKLKELEMLSDDNKNYQAQLKESQEELKRLSEIQMSNNDKDVIKTLKEQLATKNSSIEDLLKKLQQRTDEANQMEEEIAALKNKLQTCVHGASGDKIKNFSINENDLGMNCLQCQLFENEIQNSKSMLEVMEKKSIEIEAERNFLKNRARSIEVLEAELILYKSKYQECECTLLNLKELLIKAEMNERQLRESREALKSIMCQLQESEQQNQNLINMIEQLDRDLKERDIYIESISHRLNKDAPQNESESKKAIEYEEINSGHVQMIVKKLSNEIAPITCKCGFENCKCALLTNSSTICKNENMIEMVNLSSKSTFDNICKETEKKSLVCDEVLTISKFNQMIEEVSCDQIKHLQMENEESNREIKRLKEELSQMTTVVNELEIQCASNSQLQREICQLQCVHREELEAMNSNYRATICQKIHELQSLERKLNTEVEKANKLEQKLSCFNEELNMLREFRKSCEKIDECFCQRMKDLDKFKRECIKSVEENQILKCQIKSLQTEFCSYKLKTEQNNKKNMTKYEHDQRETIKRAAIEFKKHYDDKVLMIQCYEEKIKVLKAENDSLKCFRDKYLLDKNYNCSYQSIKESYCSQFAKTPSQSTIFNDNYSKVIDELCLKYDVNLEKKSNYNSSTRDTYSEITASYMKSKKNTCLKKNRSKSLDPMGKNTKKNFL